MAPRYIVIHCIRCGRELKTQNRYSDIHMCTACWGISKHGRPKKQLVKLKEYLQIHTQFNVSEKHTPTPEETSQMKRFYDSIQV